MIKTLAIAAALFVLSAAPPAAAQAPLAPEARPAPQTLLPWARRLHVQGWRYLGANDRDALFATDGSNKLSAPYLRFWLRNERLGPADGTAGRSSKRLVEVDCKSFRWQQLDAVAYAENDLKGAVLASVKTAPWQDVGDPDVMTALMFVCLGHW